MPSSATCRPRAARRRAPPLPPVSTRAAAAPGSCRQAPLCLTHALLSSALPGDCGAAWGFADATRSSITAGAPWLCYSLTVGWPMVREQMTRKLRLDLRCMVRSYVLFHTTPHSSCYR